MRLSTPFFTELHQRVFALGGYCNAHLHLDRSWTLEDTRSLIGAEDKALDSCLSLSTKHSLIPLIHKSSSYTEASLRERTSLILDQMIEIGTTYAATCVDTTDDVVGLTALEQLLSVRDAKKKHINLQVGAYSPLGYRDDQVSRWQLLEEAASMADFIGLLPERDDQQRYPEHIGFEQSCLRALELSLQRQMEIHIHVDQMNHPAETGSETVLKLLKQLQIDSCLSETPLVWLVHAISPSTYSEARFSSLLEDMVALNVGVICCPSAAISMRQYRSVLTPTYNSIARVLDMVDAGIHVRIGSDNICDITSPAGTPDLLMELFVLCNALRYYDVDFLASVGAGIRPTPQALAKLRLHLEEDRAIVSGLQD